MLPTGLVSGDDLDDVGLTDFDHDDGRRAMIAELVTAVEQGRIADQADVDYALALAAELAEATGDYERALALTERAIEARGEHLQEPDDLHLQVSRGQLLLQVGRQDDGMAALAAMRASLTEDPDLVSDITDALEQGGHAETAVQWLTTALESLLARRGELEAVGSDPATQHLAMVLFVLAQERHRVRRRLDLPHDELDGLADVLEEAMADTVSDEDDDAGAGLLFWPQPEYEQLVLRWPVLADVYGRTWDEHRARLERELAKASAAVTGVQLALFPGTADGLASCADEHGGDPADLDFNDEYAEELVEQVEPILWPPGRNAPCWCASGLKYKKCCLPRSRS